MDGSQACKEEGLGQGLGQHICRVALGRRPVKRDLACSSLFLEKVVLNVKVLQLREHVSRLELGGQGSLVVAQDGGRTTRAIDAVLEVV